MGGVLNKLVFFFSSLFQINSHSLFRCAKKRTLIAWISDARCSHPLSPLANHHASISPRCPTTVHPRCPTTVHLSLPRCPTTVHPLASTVCRSVGRSAADRSDSQTSSQTATEMVLLQAEKKKLYEPRRQSKHVSPVSNCAARADGRGSGLRI